MEIGLVGLGRMGANMARRLKAGGVTVIGFDLKADIRTGLATETGLVAAASLADVVQRLAAPRVVWLMLPAGPVTAAAIQELAGLLRPNDIVVDGANSHYRDSMARGAQLAKQGIELVDAGVSGGIWGRQEGYGLMLGGSQAALAAIEPAVRILAPAPDRGWLRCGPIGAGHFVKMVHNGIEYGMMQAYAEGFALLESKKEFGLDLAAIAEMWRHGSVVRSWLLDLTADFLQADPALKDIAPYVADSGEGRWTAMEAIEQGIPAPVMSLALMSRFASQGGAQYGDKMLAMMRRAFGGHGVKTSSR